MVILSNKIKCNECEDIIESFTTHDFKKCKCGRVAIDGGTEYLKRCTTSYSEDYSDLSVVIDINKNDIVQVTNEEHNWFGCLVTVTEIKKWGIQGYVQIPLKGFAFIRLAYEDIVKVGKGVIDFEN